MKKILYIFFIAIAGFACTNLDEEVLDEALGTDLLEEDKAAEGLLAPVYARMHSLLNSGTDYYAVQEVSSDEGILPYRGGRDWYDGGKYIELHQHTWTSNHSGLSYNWEKFNEGASKALLAAKNIAELDADLYATEIAEAKAMYVFYSSYLLDGWGVVLKKAVEDIGNNEVESEALHTSEAFDYLITMLNEAMPDLKTTSELGSGRFTKGAAEALKARLFLNKAVYIDPYAPAHTFAAADMDSVIACCNAVMASSYSLETEDYFKIFNVDNHNHPELIFAMDASLEANGSSRIMYINLSRTIYASPYWENRGAKGSDGIAITSDFYKTWEGNMDDPRFYKEYLPQEETTVKVENYTLNRGILRGQQYGIVPNEDGTDFKKDGNGDLVIEKLLEARTGVDLIFTLDVDLEGGENSRQESGYRANKYEYDPQTNTKNNGRVDIPILRLGDVYLMKAEALLRKGQTGTAIDIVNELRTVRGAHTIDELDLDQMLKERGYEMYHEQIRRTDLIRFDKFEDPWTSKTNSDVTRRVFPIPQYAIEANPEMLQQNQGY
jgi:hypothetical protein